MPRPIHLPVECWQPVVSASARGLDFMVKHGIKGAVGGGAATMEAGPITGYRDAAARAGKDLKLGEDLMIGLVIHLADTKERAMREIVPLYEEHAKMFAPLNFMPGLTKEQIAAVGQRGGWYAAGVPRVEHYMKPAPGLRHAGGVDYPSALDRGAVPGSRDRQPKHADGHAGIDHAGAIPDGRRSGDAGVQGARLIRCICC